MTLCACGCGKETKVLRGKQNKFLHGHGNTIPMPQRFGVYVDDKRKIARYFCAQRDRPVEKSPGYLRGFFGGFFAFFGSGGVASIRRNTSSSRGFGFAGIGGL